jgi:uncharacterized integral membrane protein
MLRKLVFWLVLVPIAIVILMFAIANREIVTVSFDPFDPTKPAASVSIPLFVLTFVLVIIGVFIGGVAAWLRQSGYRRAARQRDAEVNALRREIETLHAKLDEKLDMPAQGHTSRLVYRPPAGG